MATAIVMTVIGDVPASWPSALGDIFAPPSGFFWRLVPAGPLGVQIRSILRLDARAVVVWIRAGNATDQGAKLITRLLETGPPPVIAVAEAHNAWTEAVLRQTGALYLCADEARLRLGQLLESILRTSSRSTDTIRMDAG